MAIIIPIGVDTSGLRKLNTAGSRLRAFGKVAAIAAGAAGIGAMVKTLQIGVEEFRNSTRVAAQTEAVLKSTGGVAKVTADQINTLASNLERKSMFDDEAIQSGQNLLLTFTKIRNEAGKGNDIFNQTVQAMVDVSTAMGIDTSTAAIQLGKALNDPIRGVGQLRRVGVSFTEQQREQIRTLVESGKTLEAQKMILGELTTQFGGSALNASKTLDGQLAILRNTFNNIAGDLVARFLPSVVRAAQGLADFLIRFSAAPTLKAKVELITGSISEVFTRIRNWWTTGERKELPARVILTPPGREQVRQLFLNLERQSSAVSESAGRRIGRALARGILDGTSAGLDPSFIGLMKRLFLPYRFFQIGRDMARGISDGFISYMDEQGASFTDVIRSLILRIPGVSLGRELGDRISEGIRGQLRRGAPSVRNIITDQVKEAIQGARQTLQGAAGTLGGLVGEIIGGTSPEAKRLREIRAQQQREAREREDARLREAVANAKSDDERAIAERDLQDFLLEQEAIRLEESIQQNQDAANKNIANLVEEFNRGLISADVFSARLNEIIGADRGAELGIAFAGAFDRELQTILNTARDIFSVIGTGETIAGATGAGVSTTLKAENERRFQEALADWQKRRDALTQRLERATDSAKDDDSPGGKAITDAEKKGIATIRNLIEAHKKRRPNRGAYGLALGGILKQPTFVAGEAGKEAVIPLESSSAMDILRQAVGGGGGSTQVINLTVNAGLGTNPDELSRVIVDSIKYYERRNGQVFTGPLVPTVRTASGSLAQAASSGPTDFNRISQRRRG